MRTRPCESEVTPPEHQHKRKPQARTGLVLEVIKNSFNLCSVAPLDNLFTGIPMQFSTCHVTHGAQSTVTH